MKDKRSRKPSLSKLKNKLDFISFKDLIIKLIFNINPNATDFFFESLYKSYIDKISASKPTYINPSFLGFNSKNTSIEYWLTRGWTYEESSNKLAKRQSTCTPEIAKKIQHNLQNKSKEEILEINKKKGRAVDSLWIAEKNNISVEEANQKIFNRCSKGGKTKSELWKKLGNAFSDRELNYYIEKGLTEKDAKIALAERQNTTSLTSYIKKYGSEEGLNQYNKRIEKFKNSWYSLSDEEKYVITQKRLVSNKFYSKESTIFLSKLHALIPDIEAKYGDIEYFLYDHLNKKIYFYDFCIPDKKIIIEYHGSFWHASSFNKNKWSNPFYTYEDSLQKDAIKKELAEKNNFTYFIVWDYQRNDKTLIELCDIIKNKNNYVN